MKKIIFASIIFVILLQMNTNIVASLQQELTTLSDNLLELNRLLNKQKTNIDFVQLLNQAQETALAQEEIFNKIAYFLKGVDSERGIVSVYGGIKRNYKKSLKITNTLRKLINKIYRLHDTPQVINKFDKQIINLYKKIKNDWQKYANDFHDFVEKNKDTTFFNKEVFIHEDDQEIENFKLKPYVEELDVYISKANKELQDVLEEYIQEMQN